jgi:hypothetical protein
VSSAISALKLLAKARLVAAWRLIRIGVGADVLSAKMTITFGKEIS